MISKDYCVIELNKLSTTRYWEHLFILQKSIESKYQLLINGKEKVGIKQLENPKAFNDFSQKIYVYEKLEDRNLTKKKRVLTVCDYMTPDIESNKKLSLLLLNCF